MLNLIFWLIAFAVAITVHEAAHAYVADRLGDPTPRLTGRLSLNPIVHYDPVGTTLLLGLVILRVLGTPVIPFGWAKPVMFDPYNLKNPRRDSALISLAGPISNIILVIVSVLIVRFVSTPFFPYNIIPSLLIPMIMLNTVLAVFNLIPVHPLDGGKILVGFLPHKEALEADKFLKRYGVIILIMLIFPFAGGASPISLFISPIIDFVFNLALPLQGIV